MSDNAAGWQSDPTGKHEHRYWDGSQWTDSVSDGGVASTDPYEPGADPAVSPDAPTAVTPVPGDDTTSYPAAGAPPPPYVPPAPVATGGGGDGGGRRKLLIGGAILALVALAVLALVALSGDDDDSSVTAQLASAIQRDTDLTGEQADCIADLVVDQAGEDAFKDTNFDADDPPPEFTSALIAVGLDTVVDECGIDEGAFGGSDGSSDNGGSDDDSGDADEQSIEDLEAACGGGDFGACDDLYFAAELGSELGDFGSTCGGIADEQQGECEATDGGEHAAEEASGDDSLGDGDMGDFFEEAYGITQEQAECLAERITEVVQEGDLDEQQALSNLFDYLSDCDISLDDIAGAGQG